MRVYTNAKHSYVMAGQSRSKSGVLKNAYVPAIHSYLLSCL